MNELSINTLILQGITKSNRMSVICSLPKKGAVENLNRGKTNRTQINRENLVVNLGSGHCQIRTYKVEERRYILLFISRN